ncbi:sin3 binding region of histone deacetylase complex subunit SAP30 domain-containing protein [Purpureocillium lavendulum]|uniref:Sin3 binding region of histone deacetylase complex subunit SAP30 domain-containing protein n=1 Tax=Purpureocillium lavendulum TaxID=1247861 RepID=A0AB34G2Z4_9HYPO|nr:sin3 binding region of histone deacetylase complex subunit SAP30 domain-containing protein [Purpureocillium lavendulum]
MCFHFIRGVGGTRETLSLDRLCPSQPGEARHNPRRPHPAILSTCALPACHGLHRPAAGMTEGAAQVILPSPGRAGAPSHNSFCTLSSHSNLEPTTAHDSLRRPRRRIAASYQPTTMAPPKGSRATDDHKAEGTSGKEKPAAPSSAKMRRGASQTSAAGHAATKGASAPTSAPTQHAAAAAAAAEAAAPTLNWTKFDRASLHAYRREHRLATPASFSSTYHQLVLSRPGGIGLYSPTMARRNGSVRRQGKEQLAMAVRKHFNGLGVQENDVIVDFIYKIRSDRAARTAGLGRTGAIVTTK